MKAFFNWSGGKDSALALYKAQRSGVKVDALVTSINTVADRVSMHGVRRTLLEQQAASLQLPLRTIELNEMPSMEAYEGAVQATHKQLAAEGFTTAVFGDIFLEDLKNYRETLLAKYSLQCLFPLWKIDSREVVRQFLAEGFKAVVVCVNSAYLDQSFCGRILDENFINDLPAAVDPCGEAGEYHSFVFDGPIFSFPIQYEIGEIVYKEYPSPQQGNDCFDAPQPPSGFYFTDLLPA